MIQRSPSDPLVSIVLDYTPHGGPDAMPSFRGTPVRVSADGALYSSFEETRLLLHSPTLSEWTAALVKADREREKDRIHFGGKPYPGSGIGEH